MSIVKVALDQQRKPGIMGWTQRHPILAGGVALTAGIAGADVLTKMYNNKVLKKPIMEGAKHSLKEGTVYGLGLSAIEPAVLHGVLRKKGDE